MHWFEEGIGWKSENLNVIWRLRIEVIGSVVFQGKHGKQAGLGEAFNFTGDEIELLVGCWGGNDYEPVGNLGW